MVIAKNLHKSYNKLEVLKNVDIQIDKGEFVTIIGKSGAGKSTLLHLIGTLDKPTSGEISLFGKQVHTMKDRELSEFRSKNIGFVFQFHHLLPEFTALENVMLPAFILKTSKSVAEKRAKELLDYLGLKDRIQHKPNELSGGEQQRVAVARSLMNEPQIIMADEPSGNLDTQTSKDLHELFLKLNKEMNQTFVIVTHHQELAKMASRVIEMKDGKII